MPDQRHRVVRSGDDVLWEGIAVAGDVYLRGTLPPDLGLGAPDPQTWVEVNPVAVAPASPLGRLVASLTAPARQPYGALPPAKRAQAIKALGTVTVAGRACEAYRAAETTPTGERIEVTISIDTAGRPCAVETAAGGSVGVATYVAYNEDLAIEPPEEAVPAATPEG